MSEPHTLSLLSSCKHRCRLVHQEGRKEGKGHLCHAASFHSHSIRHDRKYKTVHKLERTKDRHSSFETPPPLPSPLSTATFKLNLFLFIISSSFLFRFYYTVCLFLYFSSSSSSFCSPPPCLHLTSTLPPPSSSSPSRTPPLHSPLEQSV